MAYIRYAEYLMRMVAPPVVPVCQSGAGVIRDLGPLFVPNGEAVWAQPPRLPPPEIPIKAHWSFTGITRLG